MNNAPESMLRAIRSRQCRIGIIGLGYVGLPLALAYAERGFQVLGFDMDELKIQALAEGRKYIKHLDEARVASAVSSGRLMATSNFSRLAEPDALIIAVPTPLTAHRDPDMRFINDTAEKIRATLRAGQIIVLESTTYPGTTDELMKSALESTGLKCGSDFYLAFSPEREDPGNKKFSTNTIPKIVGGVDPVSGDLAQALYEEVIDQVVRVNSARAAEASKLTENIFRAVNIALVNELKMVYDRMGINIWEVLDAASTKPFGFMRFNPGPGWGGHCIPLDPFYLTWKAREFGASAKFIELAGEINTWMPHWVIQKLQDALNQAGKPLKNSRVLLLGLAYKKDIDDTRESPALEIMDLLCEAGAICDYHDPHVPEILPTRKHADHKGMKSVVLSAGSLSGYDAVLVVTDHADVDYPMVAMHAKVLVDTRGVFQRTTEESRNGHAPVVHA